MIESFIIYGPSRQSDSGVELYQLDAYPWTFRIERERVVHIDSIPGKPTRMKSFHSGALS